MAVKKIMLWPSARSKFVKDDHMILIYKSLLVLSAFMVVSNFYMYSFMYAVKLLLMIVLAIFVTKEVEILFYSHDKEIDRVQAKELIEKSYFRVTALIYVLLIPIGTPLWLVGIGAALGTLLGKLLFGGFAHMVFHTSLVGVMFVTLGWQQLVDGVGFITSFDNYLLTLLFDNNFFNNTLAIGGIFDPNNYTSALGMLANGDMYDFLDVFLGLTPGIVGNGIVLLAIFAFLLYKKAVNYIVPVTLLSSFFVTALIIGLVNGEGIMYPIYHLFTGSLLFVTIFVSTDPITTPVPTKGKILFGIIAGALAMFIRNGVKFEEGIIFAVLFMSMLTPMINTEMKKKKKPIPKKDPKPVVKAGE